MRNANDKVLVQNRKISVSILNSIFGSCSLFLKNCFVLEGRNKDGNPGEMLSYSSGFGSY